jgi:hypothetical protein
MSGGQDENPEEIDSPEVVAHDAEEELPLPDTCVKDQCGVH